MVYRAKKLVVKTSLIALGAAFEYLSRHSDEVKAELVDWRDGQTFALGVLPSGPSIAVQKQGEQLVYLGQGDHDSPLKILFKNVDGAFLVFTGQIGAHTSFAEHRAVVHGNVTEAMQANRVMALVVKYLFPSLMLRNITKRMPTFTTRQLLLKARLYTIIGPALLLKLRK